MRRLSYTAFILATIAVIILWVWEMAIMWNGGVGSLIQNVAWNW